MTEVASKLLDFSQDLDVPLLDATVTRFYAGSNEEVRRCTCCTKHDGSLAVCGPFCHQTRAAASDRAPVRVDQARLFCMFYSYSA